MKAFLFIPLLIFTGCTSSRIVSSWKNPEAPAGNYGPVMVVAIMEKEDSSLCRKMEQRFVEELDKLGYRAFSAIDVYGPNAYDNIREEETFKLINKRNIPAVITIELLDKDTSRIYQPVWMTRGNIWNYYNFPEQRIYSPDSYYFLQTVYLWESNYYDMNGFMMLYSVQTETYQPGSDKSIAKEYVLLIMNNMVKNGVLRKQVRLKAF